MLEVTLNEANLQKHKTISWLDLIRAYTEHQSYKKEQESTYLLFCYKAGTSLEDAWLKHKAERDYVLDDVVPKLWTRGINTREKGRMIPRRCVGFEGKQAHSPLHTLPLATGYFKWKNPVTGTEYLTANLILIYGEHIRHCQNTDAELKDAHLH